MTKSPVATARGSDPAENHPVRSGHPSLVRRGALMNMTFTNDDRLKAMAIVNIFETSRPFGDYAACVVLNDGAGVSYGINQFTHRSGSLQAVVETYLNNGGMIGREALSANIPILRLRIASAINKLAADERFKNALRAAGVTDEMKEAQQQIAFAKYLRPALTICEAKGFVLPLSLAVVYDSVTHGSWERIAERVGGAASRKLLDLPERHSLSAHRAAEPQGKDESGEKAWITEYIRKRHLWLSNIPRLKAANYRTKFFLDQIAISNWELRLPLNVHGVRLTQPMFTKNFNEKAVEPNDTTTQKPATDQNPQIPTNISAEIPQAQPPAGGDEVEEKRSGGEEGKGVFETAANAVGAAAEKFDSVDGVVTAVVTRTDAAKSLWTTIVGTIWQMMWGVFGFVVGLPREVWIVVALVAAVLMVLYLYRQIVLGKIREGLEKERTTPTEAATPPL